MCKPQLFCVKTMVDEERPQKSLQKSEFEILEEVKFEISSEWPKIQAEYYIIIMFCVEFCSLHTFLSHFQQN